MARPPEWKHRFFLGLRMTVKFLSKYFILEATDDMLSPTGEWVEI